MTVQEALHEKDRQRAAAEQKADQRTRELYDAIPALSEIDRALSGCGPAIVTAAIAGDTEKLAQIEAESKRLRLERADLLEKNGFSATEDSPVWSCALCGDTGYVGQPGKQQLCTCVRSQITFAAYAASGLGKGLVGKTFDNFSMRYYSGEDASHMEAVLRICKKYAADFNANSPSLLFMGRTGLGKTHLSAAITGAVAQKGFRVLYESAQKLFDTYEANRFGRAPEGKVESYETCDLLVIDDLGAEYAGNYTAATFFNLLNTRLINGMPMIINTNLNRAQLEKAYGERVLSRLMGEFRVLLFKGEDVRMQNQNARGKA